MKNLLITASVLSFVVGCSSNKTLSEPQAPKQEVLVLKTTPKVVVEDPDVLVSSFPEVNICYLQFRKEFQVSPTFLLNNKECIKPLPKTTAFAAYFIGASLGARDKATSAEVLGIFDAVKLTKDKKEEEKFYSFLKVVASERNQERANVVNAVNTQVDKEACVNTEEALQLVRDGYSCVADSKTDSYDKLYKDSFLAICTSNKLKNCEKLLNVAIKNFPEALQSGAQASKMRQK